MMAYREKVEHFLEESDKLQQDMHASWRSSKKDLIEVYDKRARHCETIAAMYLELLKMNKETA